MHGEVALPGQQEIHYREDRLLDQSAVVGRARHQAQPIAEVDDRGALGVRAVPFRLTAEGLHVEHGPCLALRVPYPGVDLGEHVVREHRVGRVLADEAVGDRIGGIGPGVDILHVEGTAAPVEVRHHPPEQRPIDIGIQGLEVALPPHLSFDFRPRNPEGVIHGAARALRVGVEHQRPPDPEPGSERLRRVVRPADAHASPVVAKRLVE